MADESVVFAVDMKAYIAYKHMTTERIYFQFSQMHKNRTQTHTCTQIATKIVEWTFNLPEIW